MQNELDLDIESLKPEQLVVGKLERQFIAPPFSILSSRSPYWVKKKQIWRKKIADYGETRGNVMKNANLNHNAIVNKKPLYSNIDPVLCEIINYWYGLKNCKTFDPFAGSTGFGFVSSFMGNEFTGIEIRKEQVVENNKRISGFDKSKYICDDGQNVLKYIKRNSQDLLYSCPPYFNLEVYSDLPNDASNQKEYSDFVKIIDKAYSNSIKCLKDNRFAVIVCGDVRDENGFYYGIPESVKAIFNKNKMYLYNELIFVESVGTLAMRAGNFMINRKVGKCHQNVLVFYKGNPKEIRNIYPKI